MTELRLTLQDSVLTALKNNLGIEVNRFIPLISETAIRQALGEFDSFLYSNTLYTDATVPANSALQGTAVAASTAKVWDTTTGYRQKLFSGLNYDVSLQTTRTEVNNRFLLFNPRWESNLNLSITQPLLKGWGFSVNRINIELARGNHRISLSEFEQSVIDTIAQVENNYWDLVFSISDLEVNTESLQLAQEQLERNRIQVEVGTMAPIEITQARAEVASREEGIILAQTAIENNQDTLKTSINIRDPVQRLATIVPLDQPSFVSLDQTLEQVVQAALENRPELRQERERMGNAQRSRDYYRNQMKPQLDLVASFGSTGLDGESLVFDCDPFSDPDCQPSGSVRGGIGGSLNDAFGFDFRTWTVGANFSLPIKNDTYGGFYQQYRLEVERSEAQLRDLENQIALEVRTAYRQVEAGIKLIEATRVARELQNEKLVAEQKKFSVGTSTNFQVLQFQRDLTQAKSQELNALIQYNKLRIALEQAKGTLLKNRGISLGS
ncbi:MAG TPA: TolC family protein [Acidobacteriota bacterium]